MHVGSSAPWISLAIPVLSRQGVSCRDGWLHVPSKISVTKVAGTTLMESSAIKYQLVESKVLHSRMLSLMKTYFQML